MKKMLIITNPYSGKKQGQSILNNIINVLEHIPHRVIVSDYKNHPYDIANNIDLDLFQGICVIGGDGTMHEVINGMLNRQDKKQIPLGLIPGGTGNSFMHDMECLNPIDAAKKIIQLKNQKIDLIKITTNKEIVFSFNVAGWGIPPDINILAEKMRWLGMQRYNIASLIEIMKLKKRNCQLIINDKTTLDDYSFVLCCNTIHTGKGMKIAPKAKLDDGFMDVIAVKKTNRLQLLNLFPKIFSGNHINHPIVKYHQVKSISIKPDINSDLIIDGEIIGETPCEMKIVSDAIEIFN